MLKGLRYCAVALVLAMVAAIAPATAQFPPTPDEPQDPPPVGHPKAKKSAPPTGPSITGNWTGTLTQVGSSNPYKFELAITTRGNAETKYPDLDCVGKLNRVG